MMKKKLILFVSILVGCAFVLLVGLQMYWIQTAITLKDTEFRRVSNEAVMQVVHQLERIDMARQLENYNRRNEMHHVLDSVNLFFHRYLEGYDTLADGSPQLSLSELAQSGPVLEKNSRVAGKFLNRQSAILGEMMEDIMASRAPRPVEVIFGQEIIDSLLQVEFASRGIATDYEFGVYSHLRDTMVIKRTGNWNAQLLEEGRYFRLFPGDLFRAPDYLVLYFPYQRDFVVHRMSGLLLTSVLLILVIIASFVYVLITVFRERKLSKLKNDFINNMTHEFKTPISTVSLACEALVDKDVQKSEALYDTYINIIGEENKRLGSMAEKILQTAIMEKGQIELKLELFDLHEVIVDAVKKSRMQVEIKDGTIQTVLNAQQSMVMADRTHITNVVMNLLENANKYTPRKPEITIVTESHVKGVVFYVQDNGIGIRRADQRKIFDKLYRVPTGDIHDVKGFGLGLSYVKFIIEQHGGKVSLESEPGRGSKFRVFLPVEIK